MKRLNDSEIVLTNQELDDMRDFIRMTLAREWDQHTSRFYGCKENHEDGMRRMDPAMYAMSEAIGVI